MRQALVALAVLLVVPIRAQAQDVVGRTGRAPVPGMAGEQVEYRVGAVRTGPQTSSFWLQIRNPSATTAIKFVACFMQSLKSGDVDLDWFDITKDRHGRWNCDDILDPFSDNGPPNAHFSCQQISLPAAGFTSFDYSINWHQDITDADLGKVYIDFLKDCPIVDCDQVFGGNNFLVPKAPSDHRDWVNVWAGMGSQVELVPTGKSKDDWPSSNWVGMGDTQHRHYPARLTGTFAGAPANSVVAFAFAAGPGGTYVVAPDPRNLPCGGLPLEVSETMVIPPGSTALDGYSLKLPGEPCGSVPERTVIRFDAEVRADEGAPVYAPGDLMYLVHSVLVRDTKPPVFVGAPKARQISFTAVRIDATALDATTMAAGARLIYAVNGGPTREVAMPFALPRQDGPSMRFSQVIEDLQPGDHVVYRVRILDELGNRRTSRPRTLRLTREQASSAPASAPS